MRRPLLLLPLLAFAGCGSLTAAELPPAATPARAPEPSVTPVGTVQAPTPPAGDELVVELPTTAGTEARADGGATTLRLDPRARRVVATGRTRGSVGAGVGPVRIAADDGPNAYVTDAVADGVVVLRTRPALAVTRRVGLPDAAPYAIAYDDARGRLWVTLSATNEVAELAAGPRPRELRRYPSVRRPVSVYVDVDGAVVVGNADGALQRFVPDD